MKVSIESVSLDTDTAWDSLPRVFGDGHPEVVQSTIRHLRVLGVKSYVLEDPYIDRDYSSDYLEFYARTFRAHSRHCRRIHFFSEDISQLLRVPLSTDRLNEFREKANAIYCGFCVIRPLPTAPVGRTVLLARMRGRQDMESTVTCRASFDANLLGVDLHVTGTAYLQQDARVGACAQVSIWVGMRHMHARHGYNWVSVADITRFATPTTQDEAESLPAGSDFLTSERMLCAISEVGFQPLCFRASSSSPIADAILPYVESGIPVILGLNIGDEVGHAVTVIGRIFAKQVSPTTAAVSYVAAFVVHDDQGGPYMLLPVEDPRATPHLFDEDVVQRNATKLNMSQATFAVALVSTRVFSTAKAAEESTRDRIEKTLGNMPEIRRMLLDRELPVNERLLDELQSAYSEDRIVLRTYLTSASAYRRHITDGTACDSLKDTLLGLHLPHFTWITEISTIDSYNNVSAGMRRMYGHTIIDATSTGKDRDAILMLHLPGLVFTNDVNVLPSGLKEELTLIENDDLYNCREKLLS